MEKKFEIGDQVKINWDGSSMKNVFTMDLETGEFAHCSPVYLIGGLFRVVGFGNFQNENNIILGNTVGRYLVYIREDQIGHY